MYEVGEILYEPVYYDFYQVVEYDKDRNKITIRMIKKIDSGEKELYKKFIPLKNEFIGERLSRHAGRFGISIHESIRARKYHGNLL